MPTHVSQAHELPPAPPVRVVDRGPPHGRVLVATQSLQPGTTILEEQPLILVRGGSMDANALIGIYCAFLAAPPAVQSQVLDFFSPVQPDLRTALLATGKVDARQVEECMKVVLAFLFSAYKIPAGYGAPHASVGLYAMACKAAHSCQPNCYSVPDQQGRRAVRTLVDVTEGEELCVDYLNEVLLPVHQRQARLKKLWEFMCGCPRCVAHGDDTRRFPCMEATCTGHHLAHQPTAEDQAELTACSVGGTHASPSYTSRMLRQEAGLIQEVAVIRGLVDSGASEDDVLPLIMRLQPPHPHHHLAAEAAHLQGVLYHNTEQWVQAEVECRDAITHLPSYTTARLHALRGDTLMQASRTVGTGAGRSESVV